MIIGTAGHVDHGKSALVRALTGQVVDRLADEQRRGITIELGFTSVELGGVACSVVDVPGHEDFVRTMVAGASGIDVALLVIAADDGIMPQTREHLLVLEQLHVPAGIAVLAKADLVDREWLDLVRADVDALLAGSTVAFGPVLPVSVRTGEGLDQLRAELVQRAIAIARGLPTPAPADLFRLPVDRAFVVDGAGTVVTGTAWSGSAIVGDEVEVLPIGRRARIRRVEVHGAERHGTIARQRTACALNGVSLDEVGRGSVLVHAEGLWRPSSRIDVLLSLAAGEAAIRPGERIWVHHATAAVLARVRMLAPLAAGAAASVRLRLEAPLVVRGGDRLVIRRYAPVRVIGGGIVLDPTPPAPPPPSAWPAELPGRARVLVERRRWGVEHDALAVLGGVPDGQGVEAIEGLLRVSGLVRCADRVLPASRLDALATQMRSAVDACHRDSPAAAGMPLELLRRVGGAPSAIAEAVLQGELAAGRLVRHHDQVSRPDFESRAVPTAQVERVEDILGHDGLRARAVAELSREVGFDALSALRQLERSGRAVRIARDLFVAAAALGEFRAALEACDQAGAITPAAVRDRTGLTRKHLIPLLEWADAAGLTTRDGDARRLRRPEGSPAGG